MTTSVAESRGQQRRRGDALVQAILAAVMEQLETVGYARLSMEGVAAACGTGKAALYRRWSNKDELVTTALREALPSPVEVPLRGDVRDDVLALLVCTRDAFAMRGGAFAVVKAEAAEGMLHNVVYERVVAPCEETLLKVLADGAERGEVRPEAVSRQVANVGTAMLIHHSMTRGMDITDEFLVSVTDDVMMPLVRR